MCNRICNPWPYGPAIAAMAADILGQAIVAPALPFYLSEVSVPVADLPRWNGMIMGTQFAAVVLGSLLSGRMGDNYGSAAAVKLALMGQVVFFALSAFAPFGVVDEPTLAATLLLLTRIGVGISTTIVSAQLYIFDRAANLESLIRGLAQYMATLSCMWAAGCVDMYSQCRGLLLTELRRRASCPGALVLYNSSKLRVVHGLYDIVRVPATDVPNCRILWHHRPSVASSSASYTIPVRSNSGPRRCPATSCHSQCCTPPPAQLDGGGSTWGAPASRGLRWCTAACFQRHRSGRRVPS